jgi:serine/threonine protein kinase
MGIVYKARHLRLNRFVALKMQSTGAYSGPHERARFQREAEAVAGLRHANIVQIYDVGDHEGWPSFTMELLEGGSLAQALAGTPQPARQAAALLAALAEAVQVAATSRRHSSSISALSGPTVTSAILCRTRAGSTTRSTITATLSSSTPTMPAMCPPGPVVTEYGRRRIGHRGLRPSSTLASRERAVWIRRPSG